MPVNKHTSRLQVGDFFMDHGHPYRVVVRGETSGNVRGWRVCDHPAPRAVTVYGMVQCVEEGEANAHKRGQSKSRAANQRPTQDY